MNTLRHLLSVSYAVNQARLIAASDMFEYGSLSDAVCADQYIRRLNTYACRRRHELNSSVPATLSDAIKAGGALMPHAELFALGKWLLVDSQPGTSKSPGKKANPCNLLKFVSSVIVALHVRRLRNTYDTNNGLGLAVGERARRTQEISKHDIARQWALIFEEEMKPSSIDAKMKSAKRVIPCYLDYLSSGAAVHSGKHILDSPDIRRALNAISKLGDNASTQQDDLFAEPDVRRSASINPFEIELSYQSNNHASLYRNRAPGTCGKARLKYVPRAASPTTKSGIIRHTRTTKITLHPEINIKEDYRATALIDRMAIIVELAKSISAKRLQSAIWADAEASTYIYNLSDDRSKPPEWGASFMELDKKVLTGYAYAIMIQGPTPGLVTSVLRALSDNIGMVSPPLLHLVEVSVDFYPRETSLALDERILLREEMVGILQRHHWIRAAELRDPELSVSRDRDARQILSKVDHDPVSGSKVRFLFTKNKKREGSDPENSSDADLSRSQIRQRVLTTQQGYELALNSQLVKGGLHSPIHVRIQHKVTDERNPQKSNLKLLDDDERRARIEVTFSGTQTLQQRGLDSVSDLGTISFRTLAKGTLTFKLPEISPFEHLMEDAKAQLRTRGVYAIDLRARALHLEQRELLRQSGQAVPRNREREGMALKDWKEMNVIVGDALDGLTRRWKGFNAQ